MFGSQRRIVNASPSCNARALVDPLEPRLLMANFYGKVYNDLNANGHADPGEPGLAGRQVYLDSAHNGVLDGTDRYATTDAAGNYHLTYIQSVFSHSTWQWDIKVVTPPGWQLTQPTGGAYTQANLPPISSYAFLGRWNNVNFGNHYVGAVVAGAAPTTPAAVPLTSGAGSTGFDEQFFGAQPITP